VEANALPKSCVPGRNAGNPTGNPKRKLYSTHKSSRLQLQVPKYVNFSKAKVKKKKGKRMKMQTNKHAHSKTDTDTLKARESANLPGGEKAN